MRRLYPEPGPVDVELLISGLRLGDRAPSDRPYTIVNFVASVDGRATVDGRSRGLGDGGDRAIFRALRGCTDAVMAGTRTLAAERYGLLSRAPETVALRDRLGLAPQPIACTITRHGSIASDLPLLHEATARVVVYSGAELDLGDTAAELEVVRMEPDRLTIAAALADLRTRLGVRLLLCEGGPTVFGEMVAGGVADELFLTLAAKLAGGAPVAITRGPVPEAPIDLRLEWALEQDSSLFLRYAIAT